MCTVRRRLLGGILSLICLALVAITPVPTTQAAPSIQSVSFVYSPKNGGSIIAKRCVTGRWNWLSSTDMSSDNNRPGKGRELGAWKWAESGCREHFAVTDIGDFGYAEIGVGTSDSEPKGNLFSLEGTQVYKVSVTYGKLKSSIARTINAATSWCPRGDCTGRDMENTPCQWDMRPLRTQVIKDYADRALGLLKLMGSSSCGTNWAVVNVYGSNQTYARVSIVRKESDLGWWHEASDFKVLGIRTEMVYAPTEIVTACGSIGQANTEVCVSN